MFSSKRKYNDGYDECEVGFKRQQLLESDASLFGGSSGSSLMCNASCAYTDEPPPFPVVRLRGLPFDCSEFDIIEFFHDLDIVDILFVHKGGRFNGEAFCVLAYPLQVDFAIQRNKQNMGRRYIEVFRSKRQEYYSAVAHEISAMTSGSPRRSVQRAKSHDDAKYFIEHTGILRLRGLPYSAGKDAVLEFFKDYTLPEDCVHIMLNSDGRPTGEAFVVFANADESKSAMGKDRMTLGSRYIELFPSSLKEMDEAISRRR